MSTAIDRIRDAALSDRALVHLRRYFAAETGAVRRFTGAWFERLGSPSPQYADTITAADILALGTLSVDVPAEVALKLLHRHKERIESLLAQVPSDRAIWEVDESVLGRDGAAEELWELIRRTGEKSDRANRWVTAHKLCARKRPALLPVYDRDVRELVAPEDGKWWITAWRAMQQQALRKRLAELHAEAELPPEVTLLRTLDVVLWMEFRHDRGKSCGHPLHPNGIEAGPDSPRLSDC